MPRQRHLHPREFPLRARRPKHAAARQRAQPPRLGMIRHEELRAGPLLEALRAAPGHVLDHEQGAVSDEDHIESAVGHDGALEALDDGR